jgi:probable rRNA maturation factor
VIEIEVDNRSGEEIDEEGARELARRVLATEGVEAGELGLVFVGPDESRALKQEHLGIDEATDALAFPIDGLDDLPDGMPRQLGDVVMCPQVVGVEWRAPLVHAVLHLVGYDHGDAMDAREALHTSRRLDGGDQGAQVPASPVPERE